MARRAKYASAHWISVFTKLLSPAPVHQLHSLWRINRAYVFRYFTFAQVWTFVCRESFTKKNCFNQTQSLLQNRAHPEYINKFIINDTCALYVMQLQASGCWMLYQRFTWRILPGPAQVWALNRSTGPHSSNIGVKTQKGHVWHMCARTAEFLLGKTSRNTHSGT